MRSNPMTKKINIFHLFPDRLNLYGDRGNMISLIHRGNQRGIDVNIIPIYRAEEINLKEAHMIFIGGGSDREQALCTDELFQIKDQLKEEIENSLPLLGVGILTRQGPGHNSTKHRQGTWPGHVGTRLLLQSLLLPANFRPDKMPGGKNHFSTPGSSIP